MRVAEERETDSNLDDLWFLVSLIFFSFNYKVIHDRSFGTSYKVSIIKRCLLNAKNVNQYFQKYSLVAEPLLQTTS